MSKNKKDKFKCYDCGEEYRHAEDLYDHIQEEHPDNIPPGFSPARYHYMRRTGKKTRLCMICKKETSWNEITKAYNPFCCEACRKKFRKIFEARMIKKYDKVCLLNDPDQQRKMAANRKISGEYRWSNNPSIAKSYMGSYERKALEYEDIVCLNKRLNPFIPSALRERWKGFTQKNGIRYIRQHDLRHTHATMLVLSGTDFKTISNRLGHTDIKITLNRYSHVLKEMDIKASENISNLMFK